MNGLYTITERDVKIAAIAFGTGVVVTAGAVVLYAIKNENNPESIMYQKLDQEHKETIRDAEEVFKRLVPFYPIRACVRQEEPWLDAENRKRALRAAGWLGDTIDPRSCHTHIDCQTYIDELEKAEKAEKEAAKNKKPGNASKPSSRTSLPTTPWRMIYEYCRSWHRSPY